MRFHLPPWLKRRRVDLDERDFQDEIRAHLAMAERERVDDGADPQAARYAALREFGNVTQTTEAARAVWTPRWLDVLRDFFKDVRYAVRSLARHPGFSLTVVGVLTLGIGVNAAVFTIVKSLALAPLAGVEDSARLNVVHRETTAGRALKLSYPDFVSLRDHNQSFADLFGSTYSAVGFTKDRHSRSLWAEMVTGNYFRALGVSAQHGRTLLSSDEVAPGAHPVVVISDGLWRRDFGGDPAAVGQVIKINGLDMTVVGVADPAFHGTVVSFDVEIFLPIMMAPSIGYGLASSQPTPAGVLSDRTALVFSPMGFLRPGVSLNQARAEVAALWRSLQAERPMGDAEMALRAVRFANAPASGPAFILPTVFALAAMGVLVLLIACANLAGLVLVRGVSRRAEIAMRMALGASRLRIVRLLVIENLVLALPGALLGVVLAANGIPLLMRYAHALAAPQRLFLNVGVDGLVIAFAVIVACGSSLAFGFMPALRSSRVSLQSVANEVAPRAARGRMRAGLVVLQVAVSLLLLVGAGLVTRSLDKARTADPGFDATGVASIDLDLKQGGYDERRGREFYRQLLERARSTPGIQTATLAAFSPLNTGETRPSVVRIEGHTPRRDEDLSFLANFVAPGYFETLDVPLLAGRAFAESDDVAGAPVVIVNRTMAERYWGGVAQALGQRVSVGDATSRTVIGVAEDLKYLGSNDPPRPYVYVPVLQAYRATLTLHAKGAADAVQATIDRMRDLVIALDSGLPILAARPLADRLDGALFLFNFAAAMLFVFGVAGMVLAAMGTYGLVAYSVRTSTHEIGIRMALGATARSVVGVFLKRGLRLGLIGVAIGLVIALWAVRLVGWMLYGVSGTDLVSFAGALGLVLGAVLVATLLPAWRAARVNPLRALRHL
jgi:predicted permease